ncbi:unnamed protein product [Caenorhabditis angaria]|uniref:Uncharacterized protein n=1 Tax=Caenorhabditis angaria TaxID=860376 RepID=A0A9P1IXD3_9PELO|nr:unnamed protein product [Caenorhabditis angaria]
MSHGVGIVEDYSDLEIWNPERDLNFDFVAPRENYAFFDTILDTDTSLNDLNFEEKDGYIYMYGSVAGVPLFRRKVESDEWEKVESSFISENEFAFDLENNFFDDGEEDELLVLVRNDDDDEEINYEFESYLDDDWDFEFDENWGVKQFY